MIRYISLFALAGLITPILLLLSNAFYPIAINYKLFVVTILMWPSSILMLASVWGIDYWILSLSIVVNILLYAFIGLLVWWGLNRERWTLYVVVVLIALMWWILLRL